MPLSSTLSRGRRPRALPPAPLGTLLGDERGVAALEVAMVAPLMILMFFGMVELGQGLVAARRVTHACSSLGDLVAQEATTSVSDLGNSFTAATDIINPLPVATMKMRVSSITMGLQGGKATMLVDWSQGYNGWSGYPKAAAPPAAVVAELGPQAPATTGGILYNQGDTIILSEASYKYTSPIGYVLPGGLTITRTSYLRPRQGTVACSDC